MRSLAREREKLRSAHMSELLSAMPDCSPERCGLSHSNFWQSCPADMVAAGAALALHTVDSRTAAWQGTGHVSYSWVGQNR